MHAPEGKWTSGIRYDGGTGFDDGARYGDGSGDKYAVGGEYGSGLFDGEVNLYGDGPFGGAIYADRDVPLFSGSPKGDPQEQPPLVGSSFGRHPHGAFGDYTETKFPSRETPTRGLDGAGGITISRDRDHQVRGVDLSLKYGFSKVVRGVTPDYAEQNPGRKKSLRAEDSDLNQYLSSSMSGETDLEASPAR